MSATLTSVLSPITEPRRCLVVGPSWVGDMVMAQSLFITLKVRFPDLAIDVLAPGWSAPLLARMPEVTHAIEMPLGHGQLDLDLRWRLGRELRGGAYDWAILLPNSLKSAIAPFAARIPKRTGYRGEMRYGLLNDIRPLDKGRLPMTVQRFVALGLPTDAEPPPECPPPHLVADGTGAETARRALGLDGERPVLALCSGAEYGPAKRWPAEHFAAVARHWIAGGGQVWLFGSEKDREPAKAIAGIAGDGVHDLTGRTVLGQAIDLLSLATAVVSNDSGLMHVAAALDRPLVAVYGSSDPGFTPPLSKAARVERLGLDCSPCFQRVCPQGHTRCLGDLEPARVIQSLDELVAA